MEYVQSASGVLLVLKGWREEKESQYQTGRNSQEGRREVRAKWYSGGQVKKSLSRRKESTAPDAVDGKEHVVIKTKIALNQQYRVFI